MKAAVFTRYGSPDVLQIKNVDTPSPNGDEVLVKIKAASVNSWDWDLLRGKPYLYRLLFGILRPKHTILGADVAGLVEATGKNVTRFKPGDAVFGDISEHFGGFAEYVCVNEKALMLKADSLTFEVAASIPHAGVLAFQSLFENNTIKPGDQVLINGAGGGVGTFALQMAKAEGAEVTCVDSGDKLDMLRMLGADHVIDYTKDDFSKMGKRYDTIMDVVANRSIVTYYRSLAPKGTFVMVGGTIASLLQAAFLGPLLSLIGSRKLGILIHEANKNLDQIIQMVEEGKVTPQIDTIYSLSEVPSALQNFGEGRVKGKLIISI